MERGAPESAVDERALVRELRSEDLEAVIGLDAKNVGRRREEYFKVKLRQNLSETGIRVSLALEIERIFCGFLLARVYYGEFGTLEPVAVLDTLDVHPDYRRRGVGRALLGQLRKNLGALGVGRLRTEVAWDDQQLLRFFHREGFRPAERLCLDLDLDRRSDDEDGDVGCHG
jgi:ribosomal protein S18 acetylase RimI-like enzyme